MRDAMRDAVWDAMWDAMRDAMWDAMRDAVQDAVRDAMRDAMRDAQCPWALPRPWSWLWHSMACIALSCKSPLPPGLATARGRAR